MIDKTFKIDIKLSKKNQMPVTKVNQYMLHSLYNPILEAEKIVEHNYKPNHVHILFGLGDGYIAEAFLRQLDDEDYLIIIEPNFKRDKSYLLEVIKQAKELKNVSLMCVDDIEEVELLFPQIFSHYLRRVQIIASPNYDNLFSSEYKQLLTSIKENMMHQIINSNTLRMFAHSWQKNFVLNLIDAANSIPLSLLEQKFNFPVIVASGGPSLIKQIPLLKEHRKNFVLICAGSTINSLLKYGIEPDLIVSIDGGEPNYKHFENIDVSHIPLAYSLTIHQKIVEKHKGTHIVFNLMSHIPTKKWTNKILRQDIGELRDGRSVANYALNLATYITSGAVCLVGQDLAYTNQATHAEGNNHFGKLTNDKIEQRKMVLVDDIEGNPVYTDYAFLGMKKAFEAFMNQSNLSNVFNCTEGGIPIENIPNQTLGVFLDTFCNNKLNKSLIEVLESTPSLSVDWANFSYQIEEILDNLDNIMTLTQKALTSFEKHRYEDLFSNPILLSKLEEVDHELKPFLEDEFMFYFLQEVIFQFSHNQIPVKNESEEEYRQRVYIKSKYLYEGIKEVSVITKMYLSELQSRLQVTIENER